MKAKNMNRLKSQFGAVSLFIVVFSALLMTIVTVSFVTLMVTNQQQASASDVSRSALDSAQAGIEDAKRALIVFEKQCAGSSSITCTNAISDMSKCNQIFADLGGIDGATGNVGNDTSDASYSQAYSCVKIVLDTGNYQGSLEADGSAIIPLSATSPFDTVQLQWYSKTDLQGVNGTNVVLGSPTDSALPLAGKLANEWPLNRPSLMRVQLMQYAASGFTLSQADSNGSGNQSDSGTLFLYPAGVSGVSGGQQLTPISLYTPREAQTIAPTPVICNGNLSGGGFACSVQLTMPTGGPVGGGDAISFLRLTALYNATSFNVTLLSNGIATNFDGTQPEIDSTGSAGDIYRRLVDRVNLSNAFPFPDAEIETSGNLCKDFLVTNNAADYTSTDKCTP
jgi:Tfp pilus assembly protein PilX